MTSFDPAEHEAHRPRTRTTAAMLPAAALLAATLAACTGQVPLPPTSVQSVVAGTDGVYTVTGAGFFQHPGGPGMRVEACGATVGATIVDPRDARVVLPPGGAVTVQVGHRLEFALPEALQGGNGDLRLVRPDRHVVLVEDAIECPGVGTEPAPGPAPVDAPAVAVLSASTTAGDAPLTVVLDATGSTGDAPLTYTWDLGDGATAAGPSSVTHTYLDPGEYTVTLVVTDADGDSDAATLRVSVNQPNRPPTARITYTPDYWNWDAATAHYVFSAADSSDPDGDELTYEWYYWFDGAYVPFGTGPSRTVSMGYGPWSVRLVVTDEHGARDEDELTYFADLIEWGDPWNPERAHVLDVTTLVWRRTGGELSFSLTATQPFELVEPGGAECDGIAVAPGLPAVLVGHVAFDVDRNGDTGRAFPYGVGAEYVLLLGHRDPEGNHPLVVAASVDIATCTYEAAAVVSWVPAVLEGSTVTFTFTDLGLTGGYPAVYGEAFATPEGDWDDFWSHFRARTP